MKEPRRLLANEETSERARALLAAGRDRREPEDARERVWGKLAPGLAGGAATVGAGANAKGISLAVTKWKLFAIGGVIATAASAGVFVTRSVEPVAGAVHAPAATPADTKLEALPAPSAAVDEPRATTEEPPAEVNPQTQPEPNAKLPVKAGASKAFTRTPEDDATRPSATSMLREEAALLQQARAALAQGDTDGARAKLETARKRFPNSQLAQERDALEVKTAVASGESARAASLARAFLERYPDSPLRAGVESITRAPEKE